jgi:hypothetical protein
MKYIKIKGFKLNFFYYIFYFCLGCNKNLILTEIKDYNRKINIDLKTKNN